METDSREQDNILHNYSPLTCNVFMQLKNYELLMFKKTSLYRHHFSAKNVILNTDKSELKLFCQSVNSCVMVNYHKFNYNGCLDYTTNYNNNRSSIFAEFIIDYLQCKHSEYYDEPESIDYRYYKDHPIDMFIYVWFNDGNKIGDYVYWLIQDNEPRWMFILNNRLNTDTIPDYIKYLNIGHQCHTNEECHQLIIPSQILFLDYNCRLNNINKNNFIAVKCLPSWMNGYKDEITNSDKVMDAFYNYTFNNRLVKSAKNNYA